MPQRGSGSNNRSGDERPSIQSTLLAPWGQVKLPFQKDKHRFQGTPWIGWVLIIPLLQPNRIENKNWITFPKHYSLENYSGCHKYVPIEGSGQGVDPPEADNCFLCNRNGILKIAVENPGFDRPETCLIRRECAERGRRPEKALAAGMNNCGSMAGVSAIDGGESIGRVENVSETDPHGAFQDLRLSR